jgi:hypothetical protein
MFSRFKREVLDSNIDLGLSEVAEHGARLSVTSRLGGVRILLGAIFAVPCLVLLISALAIRGLYVPIVAVLFCPFLAALAALFGLGISAKEFDISRNIFTKSFKLLRFGAEESQPLPKQGAVEITATLEGGGKQNPGGHIKYVVRATPLNGSGFTVFKDYSRSLQFGENLARFLSYGLEDRVPPVYKKRSRMGS